MSQKINYREAATKDASHMVAVHFKAVHAVSEEFYPENTLKAWSPKPSKDRENWLTEIISNANSKCYVAIKDTGQVMGFAIYLKQPQTIQALYVHPAYSSMGIGQTLLAMVEDAAVLAGAKKLNLKASINAVNFYQARGYDQVKKAVQVLSDGRFMAAVIMEKHLPHSELQP